eukprot:CAMPEP_0181304988 /NCGR_PEP_ID=MMETSP1101-20121128/9472_1 /TAXON_ID=46948 /ORGANISM="Rhodomonas abbreviata, Strain Caron Lab Isolate" /LENGTH=578 /DNA_ID=CAMNT_0023410839 /DNA_START=66 /DNA_END=1803 /DNA_ORIENTATION=-
MPPTILPLLLSCITPLAVAFTCTNQCLWSSTLQKSITASRHSRTFTSANQCLRPSTLQKSTSTPHNSRLVRTGPAMRAPDGVENGAIYRLVNEKEGSSSDLVRRMISTAKESSDGLRYFDDDATDTWIFEKKGEYYMIRNARDGEYLYSARHAAQAALDEDGVHAAKIEQLQFGQMRRMVSTSSKVDEAGNVMVPTGTFISPKDKYAGDLQSPSFVDGCALWALEPVTGKPGKIRLINVGDGEGLFSCRHLAVPAAESNGKLDRSMLRRMVSTEQEAQQGSLSGSDVWSLEAAALSKEENPMEVEELLPALGTLLGGAALLGVGALMLGAGAAAIGSSLADFEEKAPKPDENVKDPEQAPKRRVADKSREDTVSKEETESKTKTEETLEEEARVEELSRLLFDEEEGLIPAFGKLLDETIRAEFGGAAQSESGVSKASSPSADPNDWPLSMHEIRIPFDRCFDVQWNPPGIPVLNCMHLQAPFQDTLPPSEGGHYSFVANGDSVSFVRVLPGLAKPVTIYERVEFVSVGENVLMFEGDGLYGTIIKGSNIPAGNLPGSFATEAAGNAMAAKWLRKNLQ